MKYNTSSSLTPSISLMQPLPEPVCGGDIDLSACLLAALERELEEATTAPIAENCSEATAEGECVAAPEDRQRNCDVLGDGAVGGVSNKLYHRRLHGKIRRQRKRLAGMPFGGVDTRPTVQQKIIESSTSQVTPMNMPEVKVAQSAWTGAHTRSDTSSSPATLSLEDALSINYRLKLIRWDGLQPIPLLSKEQKIYAVLAGRINDADFAQAVDKSTEKMASVLSRCRLTDKELLHRRGHYATLWAGISRGQGQKVPTNVKQGINAHLVQELLQDASIKRVANFGSSIMGVWAPKMKEFYQRHLGRLFLMPATKKRPQLRPPFSGNIFPTVTFNLGPRTESTPHFDLQNLAFGWCAITALGYYDYKRGGHLILWDAGLVIEFPPGSTILIPSACIKHSNVSIQEDEVRFSIVQYAAGDLFRWSAKKFDKVKVHKYDSSAAVQSGRDRVEECLGFFSRVEELRPVHF